MSSEAFAVEFIERLLCDGVRISGDEQTGEILERPDGLGSIPARSTERIETRLQTARGLYRVQLADLQFPGCGVVGFVGNRPELKRDALQVPRYYGPRGAVAFGLALDVHAVAG